MAYLLSVAIIDGGTIKVVHQFFGYSEQEVDGYKQAHLAGCAYFRSAEAENRTVELLEEIALSDMPKAEDYEEDEVEEYEEE